MGILATLLDSIRVLLICSTVAMVDGPVRGVVGTAGEAGGVLEGNPVGDPTGDPVGDPGGVGTDGGFVIGTSTLVGSVLAGSFSVHFGFSPGSGPKGSTIGSGLCLEASVGSTFL